MLVPLSDRTVVGTPVATPTALPAPPTELIPPVARTTVTSDSTVFPTRNRPTPDQRLEVGPTVTAVGPLVTGATDLIHSALVPREHTTSELPPVTWVHHPGTIHITVGVPPDGDGIDDEAKIKAPQWSFGDRVTPGAVVTIGT